MWSLYLILAFISVTMANPFSIWGEPHYERTALGNSIDVSTMKILQASYDSASEKNIVSSPLGLMILLSLYNLGFGPAGDNEINKLLNAGDARQPSSSFQWLNERLSQIDPDTLSIATKVSLSDQRELNDMFIWELMGYNSDFDKLDFTKTEEAAAKINAWASKKTKGHITEPVSKDTLTPDMVLALLNVVYFKGHWHVPFEAKDTKEKEFHVNQNTVVNKTMMHLLHSLPYTESQDLGARLIELPYQERGFRMVVVLPNEIDGLPSVLEKAAEKGVLSDVFKLTPAYEVDLDMPKFDIKTKLDFNDILPKVGVSRLFNGPATGIVKGQPIKVSKVFQEAFIQVNEEGATAGAFTGVFAIPVSADYKPPAPVKFTVDRPFLYLILHEDKIIFAGTYSN